MNTRHADWRSKTGLTLKEARAEARRLRRLTPPLSQSEIARLVGVCQSVVCKWVRNIEVDERKVRAIASRQARSSRDSKDFCSLRERCLDLAAQGYRPNEIVAQLKISPATVKKYLSEFARPRKPTERELDNFFSNCKLAQEYYYDPDAGPVW